MPLFLGGILAGFLIAASLMALCWARARRSGFPAEPRTPWRDRARVTWLALPALLMPLVVLVAQVVGAVAEGPAQTTLLVGLVLLVLGLTPEPVAVLIIRGPVHFGVAPAVGSTIGLVTPPVGVLIYLGTAQSRVPVAEVMLELVPFVATLAAAFALILLVPAVTLALPRALLPAW